MNEKSKKTEEEIKNLIEERLDVIKTENPDIDRLLKNHNSRLFAINYVYNHTVKFNFTIEEGIGALENYLDEINS